MTTEKDQTDYAAVDRKYLREGQGRSLKEYCEEEFVNYSKLLRYSRKAFWDDKAKVANPDKPFGEVEMVADSEGKEEVALAEAKPQLGKCGISYINVRFTTGLQMFHRDASVEEIVDLLKKIGCVV